MIRIAIDAIAHHLDLELQVVLCKATTYECQRTFPKSVNVLRRKKECLQKEEKKEQAFFHLRKLRTKIQTLSANVLKVVFSSLKAEMAVQKVREGSPGEGPPFRNN
jgi:hypothetical protein